MSDTACLYIVPTPIGNLSDISTRALEVLNTVDLIAAEDTRHSSRLLQHYGIQTRTISLHSHNESQRSKQLIEKLEAGISVALISDAGTPLISDPGYELVNECRLKNIKVSALPGPCALTTALSASGLPTDRFMFSGFLSLKKQAKEQALLDAANSNITQVFYESPRRVKDTLLLCKSILPASTRYTLAKELTKTFETYVTGSIDQVLDYLQADPSHEKGEFVFMLYTPLTCKNDIPSEAISLLEQLFEVLPPKKAASIVAQHYDLNKKSLYEYGLKAKENR
uniref:16S rRNA (cytidine(1402)-2'-O)-methyltransferase n=1 Tax=Ningiella ruwaisensis TaxID=2364274 RepID=UPI00109F44A5|nr:16S rRNA (cytidine(1402)-2'-O)-methyltransferase [Ningiella ruwaisensis]